MSKVRNFSEIAPNIAFPEFNFYELYYSTFEKSELGRIKKLLPIREMAENIGLVRKSMRPKLGRKSFFTPEGKVALMFLKMYTGLSYPKLLEQLNGNIHYQIFCDVIIDPTWPLTLTNYKLLDDVMMELVRVRATAMEGSFGDTERTLRSPEGQGQDEADGNPLHLLRHPHGKRGAVDGQDRTKGAFGGCLTLKLAVNAELMWGNCILAMKNGQKNPAETTGNRYKIEIFISRTQKLKGLSAASLRLKTLNDNPYLIIIPNKLC